MRAYIGAVVLVDDTVTVLILELDIADKDGTSACVFTIRGSTPFWLWGVLKVFPVLIDAVGLIAIEIEQTLAYNSLADDLVAPLAITPYSCLGSAVECYKFVFVPGCL